MPNSKIDARHHADVASLCRKFHVNRLDLFGSAITNDFDVQTSDLDFLVVFAPCTPGEHYERYFGLAESLEELFSRSVDLVEETAIRNPYFLREVNLHKSLVYAA